MLFQVVVENKVSSSPPILFGCCHLYTLPSALNLQPASNGSIPVKSELTTGEPVVPSKVTASVGEDPA